MSFIRLLSTAKYKGKDLFLDAAGGEYVSLGGRDAEMTFGVKKVSIQVYTYIATQIPMVMKLPQ
jgi:hypothetical protein